MLSQNKQLYTVIHLLFNWSIIH